MNLIDPMQFLAMFTEARTFAVVGNAPTILQYENGGKIDSHDIVVRFNRATTQGIEAKIGSRTDILVVNAHNSREMSPSPSDTVRPQCLVCYVSPQGVPTVRPAEFADWVGETPLLLTFGPDLIDVPCEHHTRPMTSGTYLLLTILRMLTVERLFVTGFTMFGAKGGASANYYQGKQPGIGTFHDLDVESRVMAGLLSSHKGRCELTPEVAQLVYGTAMDGGSDGGVVVDRSADGAPGVGKRIASGLAWRVIGLGMKLRRYAESR